MRESPLKRLWNAVKLPPPVPRGPQTYTVRSVPGASKTPPAPNPVPPPPPLAAPLSAVFSKQEDPLSDAALSRPRLSEAGLLDEARRLEEERRSRRRLLLRTAVVLALAAAGWGAYAYVSSAPSRAQSVYDEGMRLTAVGDLKGAEARFTRAIEIWPQMAPAFLERGLMRVDLSNLDGALADFQRAVALDPNLAQPHVELGRLERKRGDLEHAAGEFSQAIQIGATAEAYYQRGQLYDELGQHEKAVADYDASIHQQPDSPYPYRARALAKEALGDHDGAEQDREEASRLEHR